MSETIQYQKRFKKNIIQFLIGSVLLIAVGFYLNNHPQERAALFSGITYLYDSVAIRIEKQFIGDEQLIALYEERRQVVNIYENVQKKVTDNCASEQLVDAVTNAKEDLQNVPLEELTLEKLEKELEGLILLHENIIRICPSAQAITVEQRVANMATAGNN